MRERYYKFTLVNPLGVDVEYILRNTPRKWELTYYRVPASFITWEDPWWGVQTAPTWKEFSIKYKLEKRVKDLTLISKKDLFVDML